MKNIAAALKSGNWRALLACFLYFDTGFTVWVMLGPLAPFINKDIIMTPAEQGFLVAVPVLAAAILRVALGNLYQSYDGRKIAMMGVALSAIPAFVLLLLPGAPSYTLLLVLGVFLGMGGASFAVALPMAGSNYPPKVQGLVLGLAAAGNIGAVLDGFMFPVLASHFGWQHATAAALPLLALTALALFYWASDLTPKAGDSKRAFISLGVVLAGMMALVLIVHSGLFGQSKAGLLLLPLFGALLAISVLPKHYRSVFGERDTWVIMLVYSITFGGFVGMSSYVALLLTNLYGLPKIEAGLLMALFAFTGAIVRPIGGMVADKVSGVRALLVVLTGIAVLDLTFALWMPPLGAGIVILLALYICFGLGNGATFQLVPHRWVGKTGLMTGIIGAAGGIGGFYLPVIMGIAKESTGSYQMGFATFAVVAAIAFNLVLVLRSQWLTWALLDHSKTTVPLGAEAHAE
jgi:NNP family nitrate/nitrite transporter-like MFS transporter